MANSYDIDYEDERFAKVESDKQQALTEVENTYDSMIGQSDKFYNNQINAVNDYADKQAQIQQQQTDFTIEQIEQQKQQAEKDYIKEQSGAYVDWQKESNKYGANAEQMAASGLENTGYSESSKVRMFNTYQNRVATARESFNQAVLNYNNAIKDAQLQNNAALADIAFNGLQQELELALNGFQYHNQLLLDKTNMRLEVDNVYHNRYLDVLNQINTENSLAEQVRQYNESRALQLQQMQQEQAQWEKEYALSQQQLAEDKRQFDMTKSKSSGAYIKKGDGTENQKYMEKQIESYATDENTLLTYLELLTKAKLITEEQAADYYDKFYPETSTYGKINK